MKHSSMNKTTVVKNQSEKIVNTCLVLKFEIVFFWILFRVLDTTSTNQRIMKNVRLREKKWKADKIRLKKFKKDKHRFTATKAIIVWLFQLKLESNTTHLITQYCSSTWKWLSYGRDIQKISCWGQVYYLNSTVKYIICGRGSGKLSCLGRAIFWMSLVEKNFGEVVRIFFSFEHGPNNICVSRAHFFNLTLPKHILFGPRMVEHICFSRARSTQTDFRSRQSKHNDFWSRRSKHKVSTLTRASSKTC